MVKLTILYRTPANAGAFEDWYVGNLALMERLPGIRRRQANVVLGSPGGKSPYLRILELYFDAFADLDRAMVSPEGRAAGADLVKFMGKDADMIFSEVYEE
ncbi:MAG: EthD family reductase [Anaerolineae bacterium]|nr:EthD family reductase [Anaerolineae bacterium]